MCMCVSASKLRMKILKTPKLKPTHTHTHTHTHTLPRLMVYVHPSSININYLLCVPSAGLKHIRATHTHTHTQTSLQIFMQNIFRYRQLFTFIHFYSGHHRRIWHTPLMSPTQLTFLWVPWWGHLCKHFPTAPNNPDLSSLQPPWSGMCFCRHALSQPAQLEPPIQWHTSFQMS